MPELPEVESLKIGLERVIIGQKIVSIKINNTKIISKKSSSYTVFEWEKLQIKNDKTWQKKLIGQIFDKITRRAKNLIITMKSDDLLLVHLKMTGQLVFVPKKISNLEQNFDLNNGKYENKKEQIVSGGHPIEVLDLPNKHTHIIFKLTNGTLFYNDIRQFGYVRYFPKGELDQKHFAKLGVEPLSQDFTLLDFTTNLRKLKSGILKKVLLDQKIVVGLGNIYCDEVCFAAGVLPMRSVISLTDLEIKKLFLETQRILKLAVQSGGSSIANYLLVDGKRGNYADFHLVYGKGGKPCSGCGNILEKTKIGGRTTTFCRICQS